MAFRFGDPGGRIYAAAGSSGANILSHWTAFGGTAGSGAWSVSAGNGRSGGSCLRSSNSNTNALIKTLDAQATWGVPQAFRFNGLPTTASSIISLYDAGSPQVDLRLKTDGTLQFTRNGTVLGTSTAALSVNAFAHIEIKVLISPSAGTVEVRLNGVTVIGPLTSQNTRATANSSANQIYLGAIQGNTNSATYDYDDVIVWDGQTTDANGFTDIHDFIGDCGLAWLQPTGAGTTTQFTPDTGSNFARVNEATPDGDASYAQSSTVGQLDTYALADLGASVAAVKSVAVVCYAGKTDTGSRGLKAELRSAGGNASHATEVSLSSSYGYGFWGFGQDPHNGSPTGWTPASVNALEVGQIVSS